MHERKRSFPSISSVACLLLEGLVRRRGRKRQYSLSPTLSKFSVTLPACLVPPSLRLRFAFLFPRVACSITELSEPATHFSPLSLLSLSPFFPPGELTRSPQAPLSECFWRGRRRGREEEEEAFSLALFVFREGLWQYSEGERGRERRGTLSLL